MYKQLLGLILVFIALDFSFCYNDIAAKHKNTHLKKNTYILPYLECIV